MRRLVLVAPLLLAAAACTPLYTNSAPPVPPPGSTPQAQGPASPPSSQPPSDQLASPPAVKVLPASSHVTGLPYPAHCQLRKTTYQGATDWLPDTSCTPGAASAAVDQANIKQTICVVGYTAKIRPPVSETEPVKKTAMKAYGEAAGKSATTELDHYIPLSLGGSSSVENLWPEPSDEAGHGFENHKDGIEVALNRAVCSGHVSLAAAQAAISTDWASAEHTLGLS